MATYDELQVNHRLTNRQNFPKWYTQFKLTALYLRIWEYVDPEGSIEYPVRRAFVSFEQYKRDMQKELDEEYELAITTYNEQQSSGSSSLSLPVKGTLLRESVLRQGVDELNKNIIAEGAIVDRLDAKNVQLWKWINKSVDPMLLEPHGKETLLSGDYSIRSVVRLLRKHLNPGDNNTKEQARIEYRAALDAAKRATDPQTWYHKWWSTYIDARVYKVPEIDGLLGLKDFLEAVQVRIATRWATNALSTVLDNETWGVPQRSIEDYAQALSSHLAVNKASTKQHGVYTTLGNSEDKQPISEPKSELSNQEKPVLADRKHCPCNKTLKEGHKWSPETCALLEYAVRGSTRRKIQIPSPKELRTIRSRLDFPRYKDLKHTLQSKGWLDQSSKTIKSSVQPHEQTIPDSYGYTGNLTAVTIDPRIMDSGDPGIYTISFGRHPLANSTLIDNCGATHLVNDARLLVPETYKRAENGETVEAGTTSFPISGYGTRVIKNVLHSSAGPNTGDLTIQDVVVVEGFHCNIISEAKLWTKTRAWFCGYDASLRMGPPNQSIIICQLQREHNLTFLEYKPFTPYFNNLPSVIPVSGAHIMVVSKISQRKLQRQRNYIIPRADNEDLWHKRSGHLGADALKALVYNAQNVKITGTQRINCEACARATASQVISRREREHKSPRPFWRVTWDLFHFEPGFGGCKYSVILVEEYSNKVFVFPITEKDHDTVYDVIVSFVNWAQRQYRVQVNKLFHDQEKAVIPIQGLTEYQKWAEREGIDIELPPSYTHEPTGRIERMGKEIIEKQLRMITDANLPSSLWPEGLKAAAWLYNMSPSYRNNLRSPNEVLDTWFRQYFRWYTPELVREITADLRPNWSGIWAYGCVAYPLVKERAKNIDRNWFKTNQRAHLGYLVGYMANNIYRIWVPAIRSVIITRNVRFNEYLYYQDPKQEKEHGLTVSESRDLVDLIEINEPVGVESDLLTALDLWDQKGTHERLTDLGGEGRLGDPQDHQTLDSQIAQPEIRLGVGHSSPYSSEPERGVSSTATLVREPGKSGIVLPTPEITPAPEAEVDSVGPGGDTHLTEQTRTSTRSFNERSPREVHYNGAERSTNEDQGHTHLSVTPESEGLTKEQNQALLQDDSEDELQQSAESILNDQRVTQQGDQNTRTTVPFRSLVQNDSEDELHQTPENITNDQDSVRQGDQNARIIIPIRSINNNPTQRRGARKRRAPDRLGFNLVFATIQNSVNYQEFTNTFFPKTLIVKENEHRTLHSVIFAATLYHKTIRDPVNQELDAGADSGVSEGVSPHGSKKYHRDQLPPVPKRFKDLGTHEHGKGFLQAAHLEVNTMLQKGVWRERDRKKHYGKLLPLMWVWAYKFDQDNYLVKYKARLVARGDLQDASLENTYASTLAARSFRTMMSCAAQFDLEVKQFDVVGAFLNATRGDAPPVYCELPEGFYKNGRCLELLRALYGLKDSPLLWYKELSNTLVQLKLEASLEEPCLFYNAERSVFLLFYVDDILIMYNKKHEKQAQVIINGIRQEYELKEEGDVNWFLGIRVNRDRCSRTVTLSHDAYIEKIAAKFNVNNNSVITTIPIACTELVKYEGEASKGDIKRYQELVGSILYTAIMIRADIAFTAAQLSGFLTNPGPQHFKAGYQALRYLWQSRFLGIKYGLQSFETGALLIASDASFADDKETRRSSQGYIILLFGGPVIWKACKQSTVSTSTTEAETLALSETAKEAMAFKRLCRDLHLDLGQIWEIFCDNQQTIRLVVNENLRINTKLRHIDIQNMWLKQEHQKGSFKITYLPTGQMPADGLTKALNRQQFERFISHLNLHITVQMIISEGKEQNQKLPKGI